MTFTKEQLIERARENVKSLKFASTQHAFEKAFPAIEIDIRLAEIALESLEAEPVAWIAKKKTTGEMELDEPHAKATNPKYWTDAFPVYTAPPAPVVPDDVTGPLEYAYKELTTVFMRNHISAFERYGIYPDGSAGIQAMRIALDGMERRAAMLQGKTESVREKVLRAQMQSIITDLNLPDDASLIDITNEICRLQGAEPVTTAYKLREGVAAIRSSGIAIDAEKIKAERDALNEPTCWCHNCRPVTVTDMRFVVCPDCGNKRCPHANDHRNTCTGSNEPGQEGSAYPAAPQQEVK